MKHGQLAATVNYSKLNEHISLEQSPLYINTELQPWINRGSHPRRAAVSSFGFSGTNAHLVIEAYEGPAKPYQSDMPAIILLSAKNGDRLSEQAAQLKTFVETNPEADLYDIAYTLQLGRTFMQERLALVVTSKQELVDLLVQYEAGKREGVFTGSRKMNKDGFLLDTEELADEVALALAGKQVKVLARLWTTGALDDWDLLYEPGNYPNKISLPTYPFARERYWFAEPGMLRLPLQAAQLHPLLHRNESDLKVQKYLSIFTGDEAFLSHHRVRGESLLPGVAFLELAREAGERSAHRTINQIRNINWINPIRVNRTPRQIQIRLFEGANWIDYQIYSEQSGQEVLHGEGQLSDQEATHHELDLTAIRERLPSQKTGAECYEIFRKMGLEYGDSFQGIEELYYSEEEALSRLELTKDEHFVLQPGLLDSAIQTCLGLNLGSDVISLSVPSSIKRVCIYGQVSQAQWCYVNRSENASSMGYDIKLLSDSGAVLLSFEELVALPAEPFQNSSTSAQQASLQLYKPDWKTEEVEALTDRPDDRRMVILAGGSARLAEALSDATEREVIAINASSEIGFFNEVLSIVQRGLGAGRPVHLTVLYRNIEYLHYSFISGLLKTARLEQPLFRAKTVGVDELSIKALDELISTVQREGVGGVGDVRYEEGKRTVRRLSSLPDESPEGAEIKEGGVYLITGGVGGLGRVFAQEIASQGAARVILAGRREQCILEDGELKKLRAIYYSCDITNAASVKELIDNILTTEGRLDGIIHSAGVLRDELLLKETASASLEVLLPKIEGARNLDEATKNQALDFVVYFSSMASVVGNIGQGAYAAANAWLDNYAHYRNSLVAQGKRTGHALSINWPLWEKGGMKPDAEHQKYLEIKWGMKALPNEEGVLAMQNLLRLNLSQGIVAYGPASTLANKLLYTSEVYREEPVLSLTPAAQDALRTAGLSYFKILFSEVLGLADFQINAGTFFETYGIDSILIRRLNNHLGESFENLPATLFFEYQNLEALVEYFVSEHPAKLQTVTGLSFSESSASESKVRKPRFANHPDRLIQQKGPDNTGDAIAIIGLSGRYPGAADIDEFWSNLSRGVDCVTEIPADRWGIHGFYDPEKDKPGKSYSKWGGFIADVDKFDPRFFNISPREAELMDPQERLFLQTAWSCMEDAGYTPKRLQEIKTPSGGEVGGQVGVFAGVMYEEYQLFGVEESLKGNPLAIAGSPSSIANRVSYYLNLHGPSMAVDTMCSSSLTAIHLAMESIRNGGCGMAVAGGVNVSLHPNKYKLLSEGRFVSEKGRCESFGEGGNGYVPAEGVGAVLLKPLAQAEADGDRIYGVIKGSSLSHGGRTNGYTVPNPTAQAAVIKQAIERSGVQTDTVSYIEAHGTGTSLGDPIEIAGLNKVFKGVGLLGHHCAIGSVKSNIGHAESAAGIAGLTKVLLQFRYKKLVPSLHSAVLNEQIDFEQTPFRVQQELEDWKVAAGQLRTAGISSFGAGGSNAHLVIEEYQQKAMEYEDDRPSIIVISAKNEKALKAQADNLSRYLRSHQEANLHDIAYTLQVGRVAMEARLAFIVESKAALLECLVDYQSGKRNGLFTGNTKKDQPDFILKGNAGKGYIEIAVREKELESLAQIWVKGVSIDWSLLYEEGRYPNRISLPTYPFAQERYWFPQSTTGALQTSKNKLHPLLHENVSDLTTQKFRSVLTGQEPFLSDHRVNGARILPGVAHLELAREAGLQSSHEPINQLHNISWVSPIIVNEQPQSIQIRLFETTGRIGYEIYSDRAEEELLYSTGELSCRALVPYSVDLDAIRERLVLQKPGTEVYGVFKGLGLDYGPAFQGIRELYYGAEEALSKIQIDREADYELQPGLVDSALQTCLGLGLSQETLSLSLPYRVKQVSIYGKLDRAKWCHVRKQTGDIGSTGYDIDLLSEAGEVLLAFEEFIVLPLNGLPSGGSTSESAHSADSPVKEEVPVDTAAIQSAVEIKITDLAARVLKLDVEHLSLDEEFGAYGFDSILITKFSTAVNDFYGLELLPTVFYTYPNIRQFADFLLAEFPEQLEKRHGGDSAEGSLKQESISQTPSNTPNRRGRFRPSSAHNEPIAIIGMSGRFPGSPDLDTFWQNIKANKDLITEVPGDRWDWRAYYGDAQQEPGKTKVKWGGFIADIDRFDPLFFKISPREAETMDPQHRISLEATYHALQDAGLSPAKIRGSNTGVFLG